MFITEAAMREKRPGHIIRRASKVLATQKWHGGDYQLKADTPEKLLALLRQERIRFLVVDTSVPSTLLAPHHQLLQHTITRTNGAFALRRTYPVVRGYPYKKKIISYPDGISVYELQKGSRALVASAPSAGAQ
jgi:hypothetical protein